jgi:hypothetical protein
MNNKREVCREKRLDGKSIGLIAEEVGIKPSCVRYYVKDIKVETTQKKNWCWSEQRYENLGLKKDDNLPNIIEHNEDFAYLYGVYLGDGSYSGKKFSLSCGLVHHEFLKDKWSNAIHVVFGIHPKIYYGKNCCEIYFHEKKAERGKIGELMSIKSGKKTASCFVPQWIKQDANFSKKCLLGLMESDGSISHIYKKGGWYWQSNFTSVSCELRRDFSEMCHLLGVVTKIGGENRINIGSKDTKKLISIIGIDKMLEYIYD